MLYDTYRKLLLIPDGLDYFITEGFEFVKFTRDGNNEMNAIQLKYPDGYLEVFRKQ
jgi:hypothetical protein